MVSHLKVTSKIPLLINVFFQKALDKNLGFEDFEFDELYFPTFIFRYVSAGGNSGVSYSITLDIETLERFIAFMSDNIKQRKSASRQRSLMTRSLREHILDRDNHTCQYCGNSTFIEPNLLLEVDHIIPISRGGLTLEENLQTLCWKCNRSKGAKLAQ